MKTPWGILPPVNGYLMERNLWNNNLLINSLMLPRAFPPGNVGLELGQLLRYHLKLD